MRTSNHMHDRESSTEWKHNQEDNGSHSAWQHTYPSLLRPLGTPVRAGEQLKLGGDSRLVQSHSAGWTGAEEGLLLTSALPFLNHTT